MDRPQPRPFGQPHQISAQPSLVAQPVKQITQPKKRVSTALFRGETVARVVIMMIRVLMLFVLICSFLGTIIVFNGGWGPVLAAWPQPWLGIHPIAAVIGVAVQAFLTGVQWWKKHTFGIGWWGSFLIDTLFNILGYWPILFPFFVAAMMKTGIVDATAFTLSGIITVLLSAAAAIFPEQLLVD